jgi:hypothetical protein
VLELITIIVGVFYKAAVGATLWGWFMVPLGTPPIGMAHAIGVGLVVDTFLGSRGLWADLAVMDRSSGARLWNCFSINIVLPSLLLVVGTVAKGAM